MKILARQFGFLIDDDLKKRAKDKASKLKPKRSLSDVMRILLERWASGDLDEFFKKII